MIQCNLVKSRRRTLSISIEENGTVTIRAPYGVSRKYVDEFLQQKKEWIKTKVKEVKENHKKAHSIRESIPEEEMIEYKEKARKVITNRVEYFAKNHKLLFNNIRISSAKHRWGSCSARDNLNFNWKVIFAPVDVIDYLVVHELAHIKHKHHKRSFWAFVEKMDPEFKEHRKWLKKHSYLLQIA